MLEFDAGVGVVKCQFALVWLALRSCSQAAISSMRVCLSGMRRSRHWNDRTPSSDSARSSQLPCFIGEISGSVRPLHQGQPVAHAGAVVSRAKAAMILLHGRGASAQGILSLAEPFAQPGIAYFAPQAAGHSWYPRSFPAPMADNEPWLSSALQVIADSSSTCSTRTLVHFSMCQCAASCHLDRLHTPPIL